MIQVWCYDTNGLFAKSIFVEKVEKNMTEVALTIGYYKAKFDNDEWIEGATEEEIKEWQEKNKLKSKEPNEGEMLMSNILLENATLKQKTSDLEGITASLMLEISKLKGGNTNV